MTQAVKARPIPPWSDLKLAGSVNLNKAKFVTVKIGLDVHIKCQKYVRATMYSDFKSQNCTNFGTNSWDPIGCGVPFLQIDAGNRKVVWRS